MSETRGAVSEARYVEPGRTFTTALVLLAIMVGGYLLDLFVIGGGVEHLVAWIVAAVLVIGIDLLGTYAARSLRTITVTDEAVTVGEDSVARADIEAVEDEPDSTLPVLGRRFGDGVPRNMSGVVLQLRDHRRVVVATRHADRLVAALEVGRAGIVVRPADADDLAVLPEIDERADMLFRVYGVDLPQIPLDVDAFREAQIVYVAGRPAVGFVQLDEVDGLAHVQALAVLPSHMRRGLGTALLDAAIAWAAEQGYAAITLCTYAEIPWNGPYYASRGFVEIDEITPGLAELRDWEKDVGLDELGRRCVMRRSLRS